MIYEDFKCKYCGSKNIVKYGKLNGVQRYWCKDCKRKFADNDALPGMRTPVEQVSSAVHMYYEGMSLQAIRRHLQQEHNSPISDSNIYEWVVRFTKEAIAKAKGHRPKAGGDWVADETVLKIEGGKLWFWDIIDAKTRFLLASHMSRTRTTKDARRLMEKAAGRAGKTPKRVITDKLAAYLDGIELAFGADRKHVQSKPFTVDNSTNLIERFHGTLKARTKVMRGLKRRESAELFAAGWLIHYNFMRPHEGLNGKTPAEAAGIKASFSNWRHIVNPPLVTVRKLENTKPFAIVPKGREAFRAVTPKIAKPKRPAKPATVTCRKEGPYFLIDAPGGGTLMSRRKPKGARVVRG